VEENQEAPVQEHKAKQLLAQLKEVAAPKGESWGARHKFAKERENEKSYTNVVQEEKPNERYEVPDIMFKNPVHKLLNKIKDQPWFE
ncbi:hypothetical protein U1Q18_045893, partial [Sarracenia purpurea var. burkii]